MIKAILFDMDGTLVDTEYHSVMKKVRAFENNGVTMTDELFQKVCGRKLKTTIREIMPEAPKELTDKILEDYYNDKEVDDYENLRFPDADETLRILNEKGYRMAVVSTNLHELIEIAIKTTGWDRYFELILGLEDVTRTKPDPEVYLKAMKEFGVTAAETVIVEDSRVGLDSAIATGARVICRRETRYEVNQEGADEYVNRLSEIPDLVERMQHESN